MKVILRETYASLGHTGDEIEVKDGYARNFLVPKRIAYPATKLYRRLFDAERDELLKKDAEARTVAEGLAVRASGVVVDFTVRMGDRGKMFGAITSANIAEKLVEKGVEVDRRKIQLPEPIKITGEHEVTIKPHGDVAFSIKVRVAAEIAEEELDDEELAALKAVQAELEADKREKSGKSGGETATEKKTVEAAVAEGASDSRAAAQSGGKPARKAGKDSVKAGKTAGGEDAPGSTEHAEKA